MVVLLDTNCLYDLDEGTGARVPTLRRIVAAHGQSVEICVAAITASENPRRGRLGSFAEFEQLVERAGLSGVRVLPPMGYWDVTFWNEALWTSEKMVELERRIHAVLAPRLKRDDTSNRRKWLNTKCDVQMVWTHIWHCTAVLVTSDRDTILSRRAALADLGADVRPPEDFAATLSHADVAPVRPA